MLIRSFGGAAARLVFAVFAISAFSASARAAYITFVASNGNDANPCIVVTAPCKTLLRAYSVTSAEGTMRVLTTMQGNLTVAKSITISGDGAGIIGTIVIANASAVVTLRGLEMNGVKVLANGIRIDSAAAVHIEDCTVERYNGDGIKLSASTATELFVSDTVSRDNGQSGLFVSDANAQVTVEDSRFERNFGSGLFLASAKANVTRSIASENDSGMLVGGKATLTEATAANNFSVGFLVGAGFTTLNASVASGTDGVGLNVSSSASAVISNSVFTENGTGILNGGTLATHQNNSLFGNTTNYSGAAPSTEAEF
jgi:hypothetical protein